MEQIIAFAPVLIVMSVAIFLVGRVAINSGKRAPEELNRKPLMEGRYSARIGAFYYRGPLTRFSLYEDMIVVGSTKTYLLLPAEITGLTRGKRFWVDLVRIEHTRPDYPTIEIATTLSDTLLTWAKGKGISTK